MSSRCFVFGLGCLLLLSWGILRWDLESPAIRAGSEPPKAKVDPPRVEIAQPVVRQIRSYADFTGKTEAVQSVSLKSRLSGHLTKIHFKPGAPVQKGQMLFEIDGKLFQIEVEKASVEVDLAQTRVKQILLELNRAELLFKRGALGKDELDKIAFARAESEIKVKLAKVSLERARVDMDSSRIVAPISGIIGRPLVTVGNYVNGGTSTLATIEATEAIHVYFDVDERQFLALRNKIRTGKIKAKSEEGLPVTMSLAGDEDFTVTGKIDFVDNRIDRKTSAMQMRAIIPNSNGILVPGLSARVRLVTSEAYPAVLVLEQAVDTQESTQARVWVVNEKNVVSEREVELGQLHDGFWEVKKGLRKDEWIITKGWDDADVAPGKPVRPVKVAMSKPRE